MQSFQQGSREYFCYRARKELVWKVAISVQSITQFYHQVKIFLNYPTPPIKYVWEIEPWEIEPEGR